MWMFCEKYIFHVINHILIRFHFRVLTFSSGMVGDLIAFLLELIPRSDKSSESSSRYNGKLSFLPLEVLQRSEIT